MILKLRVTFETQLIIDITKRSFKLIVEPPNVTVALNSILEGYDILIRTSAVKEILLSHGGASRCDVSKLTSQ